MKRLVKSKLLITACVLCFAFSGCSLGGSDNGKKETTTKNAEKIGDADNVDSTDYVGSVSESQLIFNKDGSVLEIAVEDYSSVAYNASELKDYIKKSVKSYNEANTDSKVTLKQYVVNGGVAKTAILFDTVDTYNDFNNVSVEDSFYSVDEANDIAELEQKSVNASAEETTEISDEELAELGLERSDIEEGGAAENTGGAQAGFVDKDGNSVTADAISEESFMIIVDQEVVVSVEGAKIEYVNGHASFVDSSHAKADGKGTAIIIYTR